MRSLIKEDILNSIKKGSWIFGSLLPLFNDALGSQKAGKVGNTTVRALKFYLDIDVKEMWNDDPHFLSPSFFKKSDDFEKIGKLVCENGNADEFSENEAQVIMVTLGQIARIDSFMIEQIIKIFKAYFRIRESGFSGASNPRAFGIYFAGDKFFKMEPAEQRLSLIHELAHQELFLLQMLDRLILEEKDNQYKFAPFQGVERPPIGRLHSFWALFRMNQYINTFGGDRDYFNKKIQESYAAIVGDELTEYAEQLVNAAFIHTKIATRCG